MLQFLLKRFFLALPVLWLLLSVVFLLSRILPGSFASARILDDNTGFYSKASTENRTKAYKDYLQKTGQHLPLFYFSVKAASEPDTLNLIYAEPKYNLIKRLSWQYGNQHLVQNYFTKLQELARQLNPTENYLLQKHLVSLQTSISPDNILTSTASIAQLYPKQLSVSLEDAAQQMVQHQQQYTYLLPSFNWNGFENQYHYWFMQILKGNFGTSYRDNRPVAEVIGEAIGNTWWLIFISMVVTFGLALQLSISMVQHQQNRWHSVMLTVLFTLDSIPLFVLALLLLVLLASPSFLQLFPVYGMGYYTSPSSSWLEYVASQVSFMILPIICMVLANLPYLTNQIYRSLSDITQANYIKTAKAKGAPPRNIIRKHALRNALIPVITITADILPALVAGAIVIETIFAIPGMGRLTVTAVQARDYPVILAIVLIIAAFKVVANLLADLCYTLADPRIRFTNS